MKLRPLPVCQIDRLAGVDQTISFVGRGSGGGRGVGSEGYLIDVSTSFASADTIDRAFFIVPSISIVETRFRTFPEKYLFVDLTLGVGGCSGGGGEKQKNK